MVTQPVNDIIVKSPKADSAVLMTILLFFSKLINYKDLILLQLINALSNLRLLSFFDSIIHRTLIIIICQWLAFETMFEDQTPATR